MYYTLAAVRESLWRYGRGSNDTFIDFASATAADKLAWDGFLNQVCQKFFDECSFRGDKVTAIFPVYDERITLPSSLGTILGANPMNEDWEVTGAPLGLRNEWFRFTGSGEARFTDCAFSSLPDLGDWFTGFRDPDFEFYIKAVPEVAETSKSILLRGSDANGRVIYSSNVEGVSLDLDFATPETTSQSFSALSYWVKNGQTNGVVRLYAVDVTTADATLIDIITPSKTVSGYKRYRVPPGIDWLEILAQRAFVPMVADNDPVFPSNLAALRYGLRAIRYEYTSDDDRANEAWALAYQALDKELEKSNGEATLPTIAFVGGYGGGSIPFTI